MKTLARILTAAVLMLPIFSFSATPSNQTDSKVAEVTRNEKEAYIGGVRYVKDDGSDKSGESKILSSVQEAAVIGQALGSGIVSTAKELGVAANDFAQTPVGKVTGALIIYKIFGEDLRHIIGGLLLLIVGTPLGIWFIRKGAPHRNFKYEIVPLFWIFKRRVLVSNEISRTNEDEIVYVFIGCVCLGLTWSIGLVQIV